MSVWQVRKEGSTEVYSLPSTADVLTGLRDGNFVPEDEVKGQRDPDFQPLETHPTFAEAALDIEPPPGVETDDSHLDMNPLIDVCLVLLIFFILTITYASLERALDVPKDTPDEKGTQTIKYDDIKAQVFKVVVKMDGKKYVIEIEGKVVPHDKELIFKEIEAVMKATGKREMVLSMDKDVPWGVDADIQDAAKGNKVHSIINNQRHGR